MVQNNKVLTVSYGTFSCTLEGFEDSFDTMKAIAEYFRDLAADDRYFGAEPPQPDADMLARIAQREIARQVEARTSHEGIHLRAAEPSETQPVESSTSEPREDLKSPKTAGKDLLRVEPAQDESGSIDASVEPATELSGHEEPVEQQTAAAPDTANELPPAPDVSKIAAISAAVAAQGNAQALDANAPGEAPAVSEDLTDEGTENQPPDTSSADSIAAKLRRIRAVVSQSPQEEFSEDEHAESILPESITENISAPVGDDIAEHAPVEPESGEDDEIARVLSQLTTKPESQESAAPDEGEKGTEDIVEASAPETAEAPPRRRARIIKVKRAELEQAVASGAAGEVPSPAPEAASPTSILAQDSTLSDEDEDDLMRELAEVEADLLAATAEDEAPTEEVEAETPQEQSPAQLHETHSASALADSDVTRLMAAADEKLTAPETTTSRETYSHLRAAVAAAEADGSAGAAESESGEEAYRKDLASVVKPRRPAQRTSKVPLKLKPAARPAPLKLVAEQRIDPAPAAQETPPAASAPVRPRRISVLQEDSLGAEDTTGGFADYARDCGAVELPDLLEAAAAYMSFVEGRDHFSRPQLMNAVRRSGAAEFNREDGLRSFGQLLREGKIERSENGRFAATEEIGFRPPKRAAG